MKLGMVLGTGGSHYSIDMALVKEVENLGFDSIWTTEAWGSDAISPAAWILAQTSSVFVILIVRNIDPDFMKLRSPA